jgi:hypothetical protein
LTHAPFGDAEAAKLRSEILALLRHPQRALDEGVFNVLARGVFAHQFRYNEPYRAYCSRRGLTPGKLRDWTEIPVVPTAAFKAVALTAGPERHAQRAFRTSGTTAGKERRGTRHAIDLELYHAAALAAFEMCVLPDGARPALLSLMPPARELPDSSLAHMIDLVVFRLGGAGSGCFASVDAGLRADALVDRLRDAESQGEVVGLLGTSLAFVHLFEALDHEGTQLKLPAGSRVMDTGGYKGSGRRYDADEVRTAFGERLGVAADHCVNEYGMTEMYSQFYDDALRSRTLGIAVRPGRKIGPAWVRTRVVDPVTLEPVPEGSVGILQHFDLANLDAVMAIQTEDLARTVSGGFELLGRDPASPPRGCSIAMDELLAAAKHRAS